MNSLTVERLQLTICIYYLCKHLLAYRYIFSINRFYNIYIHYYEFMNYLY